MLRGGGVGGEFLRCRVSGVALFCKTAGILLNR